MPTLLPLIPQSALQRHFMLLYSGDRRLLDLMSKGEVTNISLLLSAPLPIELIQWVVLTPGQVVVMEGEEEGGGALALHGCFVSVFI